MVAFKNAAVAFLTFLMLASAATVINVIDTTNAYRALMLMGALSLLFTAGAQANSTGTFTRRYPVHLAIVRSTMILLTMIASMAASIGHAGDPATLMRGLVTIACVAFLFTVLGAAEPKRPIEARNTARKGIES